MIHFFRRIRQALIRDNKFSKYLLYAIGEIALVMIGILLALQINTWNADRQKKMLELEYLYDIKNNLVNDTININQTLEWHDAKKNSIHTTFQIFEKAKNGKPYSHEFTPQVEYLLGHVPFEQVRKAFDNMVASENIGLISNKLLRTKLSNYYSDNSILEGDQARLLSITRGFADEFTEKALTKEVVIGVLDIELDIQSSSDVQIHSDPSILSKLFIMSAVTESFIQNLMVKKSVISDMIISIDAELIQ